MYGIANVPCFCRLRYGVNFRRKAHDDVTPALSVFFSDHPRVCGEFYGIYKPLERFMVLLYDLGMCQPGPDAAVYTERQISKNIPPTKATLIQHTKPATYQAGYCWGQVMIAAPEPSSPSGWEVCWTTLPEVDKSL